VKRLSPALMLVLLSGCNAQIDDRTTPPQKDVERIEAKLSQHACIGNLDQWERNYRYSRKIGLFSPYSFQTDFDVVELHLRKAETVTIRPGRHVMPPHAQDDWPDSSPIHSVDGRFSLGSGALSLSGCKPVKRH
jgi:hypothetical protein